MTSATETVQQTLLAALNADPSLPTFVTGIYDGAPARAKYPYIVVSDSMALDWSTKSGTGRDVSLIVTLWDNSNTPAVMHTIMALIENAVPMMARTLPGWQIVTLNFVRSRLLRTAAGPWSGLVEHRAKLISTS